MALHGLLSCSPHDKNVCMYVHQNLALIIIKAKTKAQTLRLNFPQAEIKFTSLIVWCTHTIK